MVQVRILGAENVVRHSAQVGAMMGKINLTYFKQNGKWYADHLMDLPDTIHTWHEVITWIDGLRFHRELPGLTPGAVDFRILLTFPHGDIDDPEGVIFGVPHLIL